MKSFDEFYKENFHEGMMSNEYKYIIKHTYEAGQQSKQAEVDELQKRVDEALTMLGHSNGYGYEQCSRLAINILKGDRA